MNEMNADKNCEATMEFDAEIYPLLSVQKAAYEFSSRALATIDQHASSKISVTLTSPGSDVAQIAGAFKARVGDLALQEKINDQTRTVRDALVTAAMWQSL